MPAQKFVATYRIPLLEFDRMPFWNEFCTIIGFRSFHQNANRSYREVCGDVETEARIINLTDRVGRRMAVAITNSGQLLFLYRLTGEQNQFSDYYSLHWNEPELPWELNTSVQTYLFQLPDSIMKL